MCFVSPTSTLTITKKEIRQKIQKQTNSELHASIKFFGKISKKFETMGLENPSFIKVTLKNETSQHGQVF
jgi:hypothetical protein